MSIKEISIFALLFAFASCSQVDKKISNQNIATNNFIEPPIPSSNIPFSEYSFDAAKGDTLFYETGSIILFPPNSFIDKEGNLVEGNIDVKYREFTNPIDFYLAGIPLDYDSMGKTYSFESSGMCEVLASKNGNPVFVNPKSKPEVNMVSTNKSDAHSIYILDTIKKNWIYKGVSAVTDLSSSAKADVQNIDLRNDNLVMPIKPQKANDKTPVIKILIDPASFEELAVYDNLQFQLDANENKFRPEDANEEWSDVELIKGNGDGLYTVKFVNSKRVVSYLARPVFEGKDYDKALKIFEKNNAEYKRKMKDRVEMEKKNKMEYLRDTFENLKIIEENKKIAKLNGLIEIRNREIEKHNAIIEKQKRVYLDKRMSYEIIRKFEIDGFGIWNCDRAESILSLPITATFKDENGNTIELTNVAVLFKSFNGILKFNDNKIRVVKDADNMIIGTNNGRFAYLSYVDFSNLKIDAATKEQIFTMKTVSVDNNNYEFIKGIAEN